MQQDGEVLLEVRLSNLLTGLRYPTFLERLLLGISCIGFCDGNNPEYIPHCHATCGKHLLIKLGRADMHRALPPKK